LREGIEGREKCQEDFLQAFLLSFMFSCRIFGLDFTLMPEELHGRLSIFINGRARQVPGAMTLGQLAASCSLDAKRLLVELNNETLPRDEWPRRALQHGDRVEFIRVVAGG
jgi:sulfur carrier protein